MALIRVEKNSSTGQYEEPIDPNADELAAFGFYPQNASSYDTAAGVYRDASGNLVLVDAANGSKTLTQVLAGGSGATQLDFLLENEPPAPNNNYAVTRSSGLVSQETWTRAGGNLYKSIDYTRAGGVVANEVRKIFDTNGTTILAQMTITYTRTSGILTSATRVRNV